MSTHPSSASNRQAKRQQLRRAFDARANTNRRDLTYRGYRLERPDWLREQGAKNIFRVVNSHGTHVDNIAPARFISPEATLDWLDALIDEDPASMNEWMAHPLSQLTCEKETVRA